MKQRSKALLTIAGAFIVLAAMLYSCGGGGGGGYGSSGAVGNAAFGRETAA